MGKTRKQVLAEYLIAHQKYRSANGVMQLSNSQNLGVQVKTLDSKGNFVIKLSASDPWIRPLEWLHNYKAVMKQRYEEAASIYHSLFPQEQSDTAQQLITQAVETNINEKAFRGLMNGLNLKRTDVWFHQAYPADPERMRSIVDAVMNSYKQNTNEEAILHLALGRQMQAGVSVSPSVKEYIRQRVLERKASSAT